MGLAELLVTSLEIKIKLKSRSSEVTLCRGWIRLDSRPG